MDSAKIQSLLFRRNAFLVDEIKLQQSDQANNLV